MLNRGFAKRILIGMAIMSLLIVAVAVSGRLGLRHVADTTQEILVRDAHVSEEALQARVAALQLRRYEKDYFLNIGAPDKQAEYLDKWKAAHEQLVARIDALDTLVPSEEDRGTLREMRADLGTYVGGFEKVAAAVRSGDVKTPQEANHAIAEYKDAVRRLDATSEAIGGASDIKMGKRIALLQSDTQSQSNEGSIIALLAVAVAVLISLRLRSAMTTMTE